MLETSGVSLVHHDSIPQVSPAEKAENASIREDQRDADEGDLVDLVKGGKGKGSAKSKHGQFQFPCFKEG